MKDVRMTNEDVVPFNDYLKSDARIDSVLAHPTQTDEQKNEMLMSITHADVENYIHQRDNS